MPSGIENSVYYIKSLVGIFQKYCPDQSKEIKKYINRLKLVSKQEADKDPAEIVKNFEKGESLSAKNNIAWCNKIARYMAYCLDGGLLCS